MDLHSTIVLGASNNTDRYSYRALMMLREHKHPVVGVHPKLQMVEDIPICANLKLAAEMFGEICAENAHTANVHTVTMYIGEARSKLLANDLLLVAPARVIFNPGSENTLLEKILEDNGIEVIRACTLVMLTTGQY